MSAMESPCILVCSIDLKTGYCFGCGRTREEIGAWTLYSPEKRREIMAQLPEGWKAWNASRAAKRAAAAWPANAAEDRPGQAETMNPFAFIVFGILGAGLLILVFNGNDGTIGPMTDDQFARTIYLGLFGARAGRRPVRLGPALRQMARQAGIWIAIIVMLVVGYEYRFELQESGGARDIRPDARPAITQTSVNGDLSVTIQRRGRHFEVVGAVNGSPAAIPRRYRRVDHRADGDECAQGRHRPGRR
jgi:predicted Fe-S protein YdhL (DUF1289 family)